MKSRSCANRASSSPGALRICREMAKPGVKTVDIDQAVEAFYAKYAATPLFKGYPGRRRSRR